MPIIEYDHWILEVF